MDIVYQAFLALQTVRLFMLMNFHTKEYTRMLIQARSVFDEVFRLQQSFE